MTPDPENSTPTGLRVIKTARTVRSINRAAQEGFWPLVKRVERDPDISSKFAVFQHRETGRIEVIGDFRSHLDPNEYEAVIGWSDFYPHVTDKPFAAYLIPPDLEVGERVYVEDLIEDFVGGRWNQGNVYRLAEAEAIWTGTDLQIDFEQTSFLEILG
jgi:hypothetical protein